MNNIRIMKERTLKIPLQLCSSIKVFPKGKTIEKINYYIAHVGNIDYLIDIFGTTDKYFYVNITDVTDNKYEEVDFNEFKRKYMQPSLFDFFDI